MPRLARAVVCFALWFLWALPIAPGLYIATLGAPSCFSGKVPLFQNPVGCLWSMFVMGPSVVIVGPLAPAEGEAASPWPPVLTIAAILAGIAALAASRVSGGYRQR
jgi:hypothetical protein